jgi:hypothetical protein
LRNAQVILENFKKLLEIEKECSQSLREDVYNLTKEIEDKDANLQQSISERYKAECEVISFLIYYFLF